MKELTQRNFSHIHLGFVKAIIIIKAAIVTKAKIGRSYKKKEEFTQQIFIDLALCISALERIHNYYVELSKCLQFFVWIGLGKTTDFPGFLERLPGLKLVLLVVC